jgi:uncharacterized protein (DUF1778 family)
MNANQKVAVIYRWPRSFKERLDKAAALRGLSVTGYVLDRLKDQVEADLLKAEKLEECSR